jgi:hypothetical protein
MNSIIREKVYKGLPSISPILISNSYNLSLSSLDINTVRIIFLLSNSAINKSIFFALLLLLEKITLNTFRFITTKKAIANFNIKKQLSFGAIYTLTNKYKDQFIRMFSNYSLKKLENNIIFFDTNNTYVKYAFNKKTLGFGLQQVLFNILFTLNSTDYDLFAPLFENMVYGVHIYFYTHFRNYFINRLILSQYNIVIG